MTSKNEEIVEMLDQFDKDSKAIKKEALRLTWYMRGGVTYNDAMMLSQLEREIIGDIIKTNIETTKESGLPFF